jgi:hypothetical protein
MPEEEKKFAIALPGEWALQKAFGPALTEIGEDLKKLYAKGRDKIISVAYRKIANVDDGKQANLRVTRDVLWNGAFTEDDVCAEYFGGILASSRSEDGKDDEAIQFVDVIKSLSSKQLHLHYVIYNTLNKILVQAGKPVNVGQGSELQARQVWFENRELAEVLKLRIETDFNILYRQGLLSQYKADAHTVGGKTLYYSSVDPNTFGVLLYAAVHNRLSEWWTFDHVDFGDFGGISTPSVYGTSLAELLEKVSLANTLVVPGQANDEQGANKTYPIH